MSQLLNWMHLRIKDRMQGLHSQAHKQIGIPGTTVESGQIEMVAFPAFALARIAELQARCDALELQIDGLGQTRH
jgi:hypothetical protein